MTRRPPLRPWAATAAGLLAVLSASSAAAAPAAPGARPSAGTTLVDVTQQAIAAGGLRVLDADGDVLGNRADGRPSRAEAERIVRLKKTKKPKSRSVTPAAALSALGLTPAHAGHGPTARDAAAHDHGAGPDAHALHQASSADPVGAAPTVPQDTVYQGTTTLPPAVGGTWENFKAVLPGGPTGAIHSVVLATGKVLIIAGSGNQWDQFAAGQFRSWLWDPKLNTFSIIPTPYDMFCAGHVQLADGTLLIAGGTTAYPQYDEAGNLVHDWDGSKKSYVFNIRTNAYEAVGAMAEGRWYPGMVQRGNGRVLTTSGLSERARELGVISHTTDTVEEYDPATRTWSRKPSLNFSPTDPSYPVPPGPVGTTRPLPYYPNLVQLEDGRIFYSGQSNGDNGVRPGIWDPDTGGYDSLPSPSQPYVRNAGATVLLPPAQAQQVLILGGGDYASPATASTARINLKNGGTPANPRPTYVEGPRLVAPKMYVGAITLPNYKVFETNGSSDFREGGVRSAGMYDPATNTMTAMNSPTIDRLYHSEALLLPSGDVATLGSQPLDGSFEMTISVYSPPYKYLGQRPKITYGVTSLNYWGGNQGYYSIQVAPDATLRRISLVRPSATTHSTDNDQRLVDLPFVRAADRKGWTVQVPTNPNLVPPGPYMMFALDSKGRPSEALWVTVAPAR